MKPSPSLVVLAAGVGSRFGGMKQLAGVGPNDAALIDYAVYDARRAGFGRFVFIVSDASHEAVQAHVEAGCGRHVDVAYARQDAGGRAKPWGTGHAVLTAQPAVDGEAGGFGVVNADDFYGPRSFGILREWLGRDEADHALVGYRLGDTLSPSGGVSRGLCVVDGDHLQSVVELHDVRRVDDAIACREPGWSLRGDEPVSVNLWGFRPTFFDDLANGFAAFVADAGPDDEFLIGSVVNAVVATGSPAVRILPTDETFFGMTFREDVPEVQRRIGELIDQRIYPDQLWP